MSTRAVPVEKIRAIFGSEAVLESKEDRLLYGFDATGKESVPDLVVFASGADQISRLLRLANATPFCVTPRGAGSGFVGGSRPLGGGVELCLARMNKILKIDLDNLTALIEPGVVTADLRAAVAKENLFYPPDPASLRISTIGGNVATGAGGPSALKYGVTRDYVLGLELVLPTGELIELGAKTVKSVVGYDFTRLIIGSEGTLGVITKILVRLLPAPESSRTALATFRSVDEATESVAAIIRERIIPSSLEFIDRSALKAVDDYLGYGFAPEAGAALLIETDGDAAQAESEMKRIETIVRRLESIEMSVAKDEAERDRLWLARRSISPAILRIRPDKINEDVTVPRSAIPALMRRLGALSERSGFPIISFGHAGDGNIHVNVMTDKRDKGEYARALGLIDEVFDICLDLNGTLSGEHGIGLAKAPWIEKEIGPVGVRLIDEVKKVFDPNRILNPGKITPTKVPAV